MKINPFLFCLLLAFSACNGDSARPQDEKESKLEGIAAEIHTDINEAGAPDGHSQTPAASLDAPLFNYTLQKGQAGAVKINATIAEIRQQYGQDKLREVDLIEEGVTTRAYEILGERGRTDLRVEQECSGEACTVFRITVLNPAFKSPGGIGIGSTFEELKKQFTISQVMPGDEHFLATSKSAKMTFFLDLGDIPASRWANLKKKDIPNSAKVTGLVLY